MSKASKARVISREFKLSAVRRMLAGENVSALLWRISRTDEASLDDYEGVDQGFYVKGAIEVSVSGDRKRSAFAYIATESRIGRPRPGYLEPIISAARDLGFPLRYIEELMSWRRGVARRSEHLV
jgi:hypothetical protein